MTDHSYEIELVKSLLWIPVVEQDTDPATLQLKRLIWGNQSSPPLKVIPVHERDFAYELTYATNQRGPHSGRSRKAGKMRLEDAMSANSWAAQ